MCSDWFYNKVFISSAENKSRVLIIIKIAKIVPFIPYQCILFISKELGR